MHSQMLITLSMTILINLLTREHHQNQRTHTHLNQILLINQILDILLIQTTITIHLTPSLTFLLILQRRRTRIRIHLTHTKVMRTQHLPTIRIRTTDQSML